MIRSPRRCSQVPIYNASDSLDLLSFRTLNGQKAQTSPGFGHETRVRSAVYEQLLPSMIDIVSQIIDKQQSGLPIFPMTNTGNYELVYTDDYQFAYDFQHKPQQRGPC